MKKRLHTWWVSAGTYYKQIGCRTYGMEDAKKKAYEKLIKMSYEEFCEYIPFNVAGSKDNRL